jgi:hypothetical protein
MLYPWARKEVSFPNVEPEVADRGSLVEVKKNSRFPQKGFPRLAG